MANRPGPLCSDLPLHLENEHCEKRPKDNQWASKIFTVGTERETLNDMRIVMLLLSGIEIHSRADPDSFEVTLVAGDENTQLRKVFWEDTDTQCFDKLLKMIRERGTELDGPSCVPCTPLHILCANENIYRRKDIIRALLEAGANPNRTTNWHGYKMTALHLLFCSPPNAWVPTHRVSFFDPERDHTHPIREWRYTLPQTLKRITCETMSCLDVLLSFEATDVNIRLIDLEMLTHAMFCGGLGRHYFDIMTLLDRESTRQTSIAPRRPIADRELTGAEPRLLDNPNVFRNPRAYCIIWLFEKDLTISTSWSDSHRKTYQSVLLADLSNIAHAEWQYMESPRLLLSKNKRSLIQPLQRMCVEIIRSTLQKLCLQSAPPPLSWAYERAAGISPFPNMNVFEIVKELNLPEIFKNFILYAN